MTSLYALFLPAGMEFTFQASAKGMVYVPRRLVRNGYRDKYEEKWYPVFKGLVFTENYDAQESGFKATPLFGEERALAEYFIKAGDVGVAKVRAEEDGKIVIEGGPLKGLEERISRVNTRRQRLEMVFILGGETRNVYFSYMLDQSLEEFSRLIHVGGYRTVRE